MKPREPRRTVLIRARMRTGALWPDILIHNISSRGLMAQTDQPPKIGTYVEIRRDQQIIIGRAVWRTVHNFGILTQDRIDIDAVIQDPIYPGTQRPASPLPERRSDPQRLVTDIARKAEKSRRTSALLQFIVIGAIGAAAAGLAATEVYTLLTSPLEKVATHLSEGG
jgi:hypothetical protein